MDFSKASSVVCELAEGPVYDDRRNGLFYCDIVGRNVHFLGFADGDEKQWSFDSEVGSLGLCESGKLVVALRNVVGLFDPDKGTFEEIAEVEADNPGTRLNDGKVGPDGAFWVGTMDDRGVSPREPVGALYRVSANSGVEQKVTGLRVSNGLAFSPDGTSLFHADSGGPWVDRWTLDPATGAIANRTRIAEPEEATGRPDGAATDVDGNYWSAGVSAGRLNVFSPEGKLLRQYDLPVGAPTMPCFAGEGLKTLFVTSLRSGRSAELLEKFPLTGTLISADSPVSGTPVHRFGDIA